MAILYGSYHTLKKLKKKSPIVKIVFTQKLRTLLKCKFEKKVKIMDKTKFVI